jgi:hypothetical protein
MPIPRRMSPANTAISLVTGKKHVEAVFFFRPAHPDFCSLSEFEKCLSNSEIPLDTFRMLCFGGIPDTKGFRSKCWKARIYSLLISL